jgi:aryl-alcohol dehydrogenase-like predicted oxidoreductase
MRLTRREWLKGVGAAAGGLALAPAIAHMEKPLPKRKLGKMGWEASLFALGTAEFPGEDEGVPILHLLLDAGVNYIDTAPSYQGTRSESVVGKVLAKRRNEVFIATKTLQRDADGAYAEVERSLGRLQCKQIDLLQVHAVNDADTLDRVLGADGAVRGLERARKNGLIRFIGITGHTRPEVILQALKRYPFDSILVPVSALDAHLHDFATEVIPYAVRQGTAVVGMKSLKGMEIATKGAFEPKEYLRYACSLPISTLTVGLRRAHEAKENLSIFREFVPMSRDEMKDFAAKHRSQATEQVLWWKRR